MFFLRSDLVDLGWDLSMDPVSARGGTQYEIKVFDDTGGFDTYHTTRVISSSGADHLRGRGTRVWEAYNTADARKIPVVLKDCWIDVDRESEGKLRQIIADNALDADAELVNEHFLTVLKHGYVQLAAGSDQTRDLGSTTEFIPVPMEHLDTTHASNSASIPSQRSQPGQRQAIPLEPEAIIYHQKVHYRIVFAEVGEPLSRCDDLRKVFLCLRDAVEGLRIMHHGRKAYVHRDISPNNIIIVEGRGRVADLEYVKEYQARSSHNIRTGTVDYMAVEVEMQGYLSTPFTKFHHSPLHDLESVAWTAIEAVLSRHPSEADLPEAKTQASLGAKYFYSIGAPIGNDRQNKRQSLLVGRHKLSGVQDALAPYAKLAAALLYSVSIGVRDVNRLYDQQHPQPSSSQPGGLETSVLLEGAVQVESPLAENVVDISKVIHRILASVFAGVSNLDEVSTIPLSVALGGGEKRGVESNRSGNETPTKRRKTSAQGGG